ncbi:MAG: oxidoreductase [Nocardioides sp.]|nr:oxidoreductase [Nocardioides sp.]
MSRVPGLALVTGAATGVGAELARCFVQDGYAVVVASDEPEVHDVAAELRAEGGTVVAALVDLAAPGGVEQLHQVVLDQPELLEAVAFTVRADAPGRQHEVPVNDDLRVVDANVRSTVHLAKLVLPDLVRRAHGRLLFLSPAAPPGPHHATYAASTAFVHSYAASVRHEVRVSGLTVTSAQPAPADTASGADARDAQPSDDDAAEVAREAYEAMRSGADQVVTGSPRTRLAAAVAKVVPDRITAAVAAR